MGCQTSSPCNNLNLQLRLVLIDTSRDKCHYMTLLSPGMGRPTEFAKHSMWLFALRLLPGGIYHTYNVDRMTMSQFTMSI